MTTSAATNYLTYNPATGAVIGLGFTPDGTLPPNSIACTADQALQPQQYQVDVSANPVSVIAAPAAQLLSLAQAAQVAVLQASYQEAINTPVNFKNAAGVTSTYAFGNALSPSGSNAQDLLTQIISAGASAWKAGVWFDVNGVAQTMTFADLQGLAAAIEAMETPDEQDLMTKIAAVQAATTVAGVQAITF